MSLTKGVWSSYIVSNHSIEYRILEYGYERYIYFD